MNAGPNRGVCGWHFALRAVTVYAILLSGMDHAQSEFPPVRSVTVVDIIPESLSGESNMNCEPNLTVNPADPSQIAASARLPEPMGRKMSVVFVSADSGTTWSCRSTVPIETSPDDTVRFGGLSITFYVAALRAFDPTKNNKFVICRSNDFAKSGMESILDVKQQPLMDQPYIAAAMINQLDRVFVGVDDWNGPPGRTATVVRSLDGTGNPPSSDFTRIRIEFASPPPQRDNSEIRPAISADRKKVYAVFNRVSSINGNQRVGDVVLVRDDDGGNSGTVSFTGLHDQNGTAGFPVVKARTFLFDMDGFPALLGRQRLGGDLAIAVDPGNADKVYLVWGEVLGGQPALHVICSDNGGTNWSPPLYTVTKAINPGLAINTNGTLAFLYQELVTDPDGVETWCTQLKLTRDDFKNIDPFTLSKFPDSELGVGGGLPIVGQPRLGDYLHLLATGNDFYGIFSASNVPDQSRFPCGVIFQRHKNFTTKKLLDQQNAKEVPSSVDPFFFKLAEQ
jgi:hypothetical protein